jgi:hypothetical protein
MLRKLEQKLSIMSPIDHLLISLTTEMILKFLKIQKMTFLAKRNIRENMESKWITEKT